MNKMNTIIVLETRGKHETVDYATVHLFKDPLEAECFCASKRTGKIKHWTNAEIVTMGETVELRQPDNE